jgi:putative aldouronate transport system substrate-binding protein
MAAFGGPINFYQDLSGKIQYGPAQDWFAEYLQEMAKWYAEGLIDPEFAARDGAAISQLEASLQMAARQYEGTSIVIRTRNFAAESGSDAFMIGAPYPTRDADTPLHWRYQNFPCRGEWTMFFDTPNVREHLTELIRWFDYGYTIEGAHLYNFGVFGQSHTGFDELGRVIYADYILEDNFAAFETYQEVMRRHNGPYLKSDLRSMFRRFLPELEINREIWQEQPNPGFLPPYTLNEEEGREAAGILADIETFVDESIVRFIMGQEPASNAMSVPETVRNMNIDRVIALHEQALARYHAR